MSDVQYSVEISYLTSGSLHLPAGIANAGKDIDKINSQFANLGSGFARGFGSAVDTVGGAIVDSIAGAAVVGGGLLVAGIGTALKEGLNFAGFVESNVNGLAATLSMLGDVPLDKGLKQANASVENLRKAAAVLPGEFKDALGAFSSILPAGLNSGVDIGRLEKLGAQSVAVAASLGIKQNVAGHELAAILEGRARSSMPLVARLGIHATDWNKQKADVRFQKIETMFGKMDPAMKQFQESWAGLTSTARDNARNVAKSFAEPLFGSLKGELGRGLEWFGQNESAVHAFANTLGVGIDIAFHRGLDAAHKWIPIAITFGRHLYNSVSGAFAVAGPYLDRFSKLVERVAKDPSTPHMLGSAAMALGGAKVASVGADLGLDAVKAFGPLLSAAGFSAAELAAVALPAAAAVALLSVALVGAADIITDTSNSLHSFAMGQLAQTGKNMGDLAKESEKLWNALRPLVDLLGADLLLSVNLFTGALDQAVWHVNKLVDVLDWITKHTPGYTPVLNPTEHVYSPNPWEQPLFPKMIEMLQGDGGLAAKKPPVHNTTVHGGIRIQVDGNADPQRVARLTKDLLFQALRNPTQSAAGPTNFGR